MDLTPHLVVGAAIGARVRRPALALPAAFVSHFVLDTVPHFDIGWINGPNLSAAIDAALGLVLCGVLVWSAGNWGPLTGALAAVLPDAPGIKEYVEGTAAVVLPHLTAYPPWGIATEVLATAAALGWGLGGPRHRSTVGPGPLTSRETMRIGGPHRADRGTAR